MEVPARYQTFGQRFGAGLIDGLVFLPLAFVDDFILQPDRPTALLGFWIIVSELIYYAYSIVLHAKYGQTIGKMITHVKVLDQTETRVPGFRRAFLRDGFYLLTSLLYVGYLLWLLVTQGHSAALNHQMHDGITYALAGWFFLELITMFTNRRRRSLHDFIGGTVVVDTRCDDVPGRINPIHLPGASRSPLHTSPPTDPT